MSNHMMKTVIPPSLEAGDTIGIVCPSGYLPAEKVDAAVQAFRSWGYRVVTGKTVGHQYHYFSGTDKERLRDLQRMMDDDSIQAVFCGRGGYGMGRIIDLVRFRKFRERPKWIIGYSDITVLQMHLYARYGIASLHAPMASSFIGADPADPCLASLRDALAGRPLAYEVPAHEYNRPGRARGTLIGGNLSLLAHLTGTRSEAPTKNALLFIEDVGEYIYNIDRMMYQLRRSGQLKKLAGLIVGRFTESRDTVIPFGMQPEDVIRDVVKDYDYPVCFHFPVSHDRENFSLKIGCEYDFAVTPGNVVLRTS